MADFFSLALFLVVFLALVLVIVFLFRQNRVLKENLGELLFKKTSQSVKYGKLTEQFIPFTEDFPFDPANFRFIGAPIDGIVFGDESIFFCEFKTASSVLSPKQKRIKRLVEEKKVKWFEFKLR